MSSIYVLEPPTKGKVILNTSYGPLDIELWPKEAPKATRNFLQLCLEGYYDNTVFHRVIKGFIVQGGDPTGTGTGGESIYGEPFVDEFHSRLRFNHRGLVACANEGKPNSNGSQFFFSLDRCDWLDRKHTIFGKVTGDSIYNLLNIGNVETDKNDRPFDPLPTIKSVEVLWNPFDDIIPREAPKMSIDFATVDTETKFAKGDATKKLNLLSFGEEAEEEERELESLNLKIKSSHDVLNDPRLLKAEDQKDELNVPESSTRDIKLSIRDALRLTERTPQPEASDSDDDETKFDEHMRLQVLRKGKELGNALKQKRREKVTQNDGRESPDGEVSVSSVENCDDNRARIEKLSLKKRGVGSEARAKQMATADSDIQLLREAERGRLLQKQKKRRLHGREEDVLSKLDKFRALLSAKSDDDRSAENDDLANWASSGLIFEPDPVKDQMSRKDDPNDYVVHDPLLEKGKEKFNRMIARQKRKQREWAGKSIT